VFNHEPTNPTNPTKQPMKLNALLKTAGFLALAASPALAGSSGKIVAPGPVAEEPSSDLGITASLGYDTNFIFRGVDFAEHWVSGGIALDIPLVDNVSFVGGASYGVTADNNAVFGASYQRLEMNGGVAVDLGAAELGLGYRWYNHQGGLSRILEDGHEVGMTLGTSLGPVNVGIAGYYDFGIEGWYFEAAANTEIALTDSVSLVPGVSIGYAQDYSWHIAGFETSGFTTINLSLALPIKLTKNAVLTPYVAGNLPIDALDDAGEDAQIFGGVKLSVSF
jgi:hypothetical protein